MPTPTKLMLFDTETTDKVNQRIIQFAYKRIDIPTMREEASRTMLFKPPEPIALGAMAVHHITNEAVAQCEPFSSALVPVQAMIDSCIPVAHNASFDLQALRNEGITNIPVGRPHICTYKLAVHLFPDFENHTLQYLRYALKCDQPAFHDLKAHDALADVLVLEAVLYSLLWKFIEDDPDLKTCEDAAKAVPSAIGKMMDLCVKPILYPKITFGKYKGKTYDELRLRDKGYLEWLLDNETKKPLNEQNENLTYTIRHYLR